MIMWGKVSIYLANTDPREDKGADVEWLNANCLFIYLDKSILA